MIPAAFEYFTPSTLSEAIALLEEHGDEAKILSGGHSLIPMMRYRLASPEKIVDINGIPDLEYIKEEDGYLKIGGLTREVALEDTPMIREKYPLLYDTAIMIADPQVRNVATIGGNIAHGDAANDHPATMLALGAEVVATGPNGERVIPIDDFFLGLYYTALEPSEIITEIRIPAADGNSSGTYKKMERKVGDYATAAVAVQVTMNGSGPAKVGIGLTNVGPTPIRAKRSEELLVGKPITDELIKEAGKLASEDCSPTADLRGSEEYKRSVVSVLTQRALKIAFERALSS
ncbi:carbon monoxide dehydrogenase [marine bacterium AO1-C]|nr:carbon monoxide dehydrogenase [marine bacterium AO1-C]